MALIEYSGENWSDMFEGRKKPVLIYFWDGG